MIRFAMVIFKVTEKLPKNLDQIIWSIFLILAIATPLIFSTFNTELFEVPKMHFVYALSTLLLFLTIAKFVLLEKILIPKSLVLNLFAVFVAVQIFSAFFSIDKYTSIFGFPSRLNGGLISQFAYLIIFATALINLTKEHVKIIFVTLTISAFAVSLWGIPGHFGKDPSCFVLTGELTSTCWKVDFQPTLRIFSTLGQPNWLASYLVLILPLSLSLFLKSQTTNHKLLFLTGSTAIYWAIFLTNSRAGIIGLILSAVIFLFLLEKKYYRKLTVIAIIFILISFIFSSTLQSRLQNAVSNQQSPNTPPTTQTAQTQPSQTALETGGTESGQIRLIIWQGALNIVKKWPILGSGPETFVSSYFIYRPETHNQTSEWEFFYNKAHNEYLNYLANNGVIGFGTYIAFIIAVFWSLFKFRTHSLFTNAAFASLAGYLATIFFGFSTVATQTAAHLIIASALIYSKPPPLAQLKFKLKENYSLPILLLIALLGLYVLSFTFRSYMSNVFEKRAENFKGQNSGKELTAYANAQNAHFVKNPYLLADYSSALATASTATEAIENSTKLASEASSLGAQALKLSPNNFLIAQRVARAYALLATQSDEYNAEAQNIEDKLIELAPNYPITYLTNAKIEIILDNNKKAIEYLEKTLELKPDYLEARKLLDQVVYSSQSQESKKSSEQIP